MSAVSSISDIPVCVECGTEEEEISTNKKECTSCEQNLDEGAPCELLNDMSISGDVSAGIVSTCANCGKEGSGVNNTCNKCKMVKYCNAACKKKHRHKHKKDCEEYQRLAAERAAELHDKQLFKQPPPQVEDCPICFLRMPSLISGRRYQSCCGKVICSGCIYAVQMRDGGVGLCPFCRTRAPQTEEEIVKRNEKRMDAGDATSIYNTGRYYAEGLCGLPQDYEKELELYHRAAELGNAPAYYNIGCAHKNGVGVEVDVKKARHYWELAAMRGHVKARYNLGALEENAGNTDRALRHFMIAAGGGHTGSLKVIQNLFTYGDATKGDYTTSLRAYQEYLGEVKSAQREEAAACHEDYKYIE